MSIGQKLTLTVPIRLYAIYQENDKAVVGPEMDFESLPYFDKALGMDINPDVPYLAESIVSLPFEDTNFLLQKGVHLNWDFPRFLKSTAYRAKETTAFPAVPTRWLISRYPTKGDQSPDQQWIVESDALLTDLKGAKIYEMAQTSLPIDIYSGERPFTYMGRVEKLDDWKNRQTEQGAHYTNWKEKHPTESLTALGWGSPSFDVFYPNCRNVFGFHDPDGTSTHMYKVIGWYDRLDDDYWLTYLKAKEGAYGFSDIDDLTHLTAERKEELKKEQFDKAIREDFGIALEYSAEVKDLASPDAWERMICCGASRFLENELRDPTQFKFAVGNTPIEALSAMIAEDQPLGELSQMEKTKLEDSLSAMLMGDRLKSKKLDIGPKFREFRHADAFAGSDGGIRWVIEKVSNNPEKKVGGEGDMNKKLPPPLPSSLLPLLEALNDAQQQYDRQKEVVESCRFELYADWYRYMHVAYPPPGETQEYFYAEDLRAMIRMGSLKKLNEQKNLLGGTDLDHLEDSLPYQGLQGTVRESWEKLQTEIGRINQEITTNKDKYLEAFQWVIQHRPAPRFWEPSPPVMVVAIPRTPSLQPDEETPKTVVIDSSALGTVLVCNPIEAEDIDYLPSQRFSLPQMLSKPGVVWTVPQDPYSTDLPIFKGDWQVKVHMVADHHSLTHGTGSFATDFIQTNYVLGENEPDLEDNRAMEGPLHLTKTGSIYTGSTYVNQNLDDRYRSLLENFCALETSGNFNEQASKARDFLHTHDLLAISLNAFNTALLQRHESIQLNPADPLGFDDCQIFAKEVAEALKDNYKGVSPDPHAPFLPIRSGALQVITLRLVDIFGRFLEVTPTRVSTAISMEVPGKDDWVRLPPRLSQPARWNFRFLNSEPDAQSGQHLESQSHPDSSPIHGWIVPNLLDNSLDFFEPDGRLIGSIIREENPATLKWQSDADEQDNVLFRIKDWLFQQNEPAFLDTFIASIEEAMDNIHPDDREGQSAFSVLMGRPMAVVHLGVELELKGLPAINVGWNELHRDLNRTNRSTDDFDQVQFPYRLGEYRQRNDGLVGYWKVEDGQLSAAFSVNDAVWGILNQEELNKYNPQTGAPLDAQTPALSDVFIQKNSDWKIWDENGQTLFQYLLAQEDNTVKKQDLIQPYVREGNRIWEALKSNGFLIEEKVHPNIQHYDETGNLSISATDPMQHLIALTDPYGVIHLSSGIQPVKDIQLPIDFIQDALNRIEISFLTAPILTPEDHIQLSLPKQQEFNWAWREPNPWPTHKDEALLETEIPEKDLEPFRTVANFPDRVVIREGRLVIKHKTETVDNQ